MEHNVDVPMPQNAETGRVKEVKQLIARDRSSDCDNLANDVEQKAPRNVSWCCDHFREGKT